MDEQNQTPPAAPAIESLTAELAAEKQARTALEGLHTALQTKYDDEVVAHQNTKIDLADAGDVVNEQHATITDLTAQIEKMQAAPATYPVITVDKVTYEVTAKTFQHKKVEYTVADLLKDKALQKELVKKGVGFLVAKTA